MKKREYQALFDTWAALITAIGIIDEHGDVHESHLRPLRRAANKARERCSKYEMETLRIAPAPPDEYCGECDVDGHTPGAHGEQDESGRWHL